MPVRRSLSQQREQALRRATGAAPDNRARSPKVLRRAMVAFELRGARSFADANTMRATIDRALRQATVPSSWWQRFRSSRRVQPTLWMGGGSVCGVVSSWWLISHGALAWSAAFASFGVACVLYGVAQWKKTRPSAHALDRIDWQRAGERYDQAWALLNPLTWTPEVHDRLTGLHATAQRLVASALASEPSIWSLQERVALESTIGDYIPDAIHAYMGVPLPHTEAAESFERQLQQLLKRLQAQEALIVQRTQQRLHAHERFLNGAASFTDTE